MQTSAACLCRAIIAAALAVTIAAPAKAAVHLDPEFVVALGHRDRRRHPFSDASGRLPLVVEVSPATDPRALGWLPISRHLATVRVLPVDLPRFAAAHPGARFSIWPGLHPVLDESARRAGFGKYRASLAERGSPVPGTGKGVVVGVIDTGIDAAHADFRDAAGHSRIAWMLDFASLPLGLHPELEDAFGCTLPAQSPCAVLDRADIERAFAGDRHVLLPTDPVGHGTHVASIAAGNGGTDARFVGGAPEATLVIASVAHGGGTVVDADIVTAARFIFDRAEQLGMPAVVNLSLGGDFGPHDGTSPIEEALAELVGPDHPGRSIVVAAGNSGTMYSGDREGQVLGIHSETRVTGGAPAKLTVMTPQGKKGSDVSGTVFVWMTYGATDTIAVGLAGPKGMSIRPVAEGGKAGFRATDDSLTASIFNGAVGSETPLPARSHGAIAVWDGRWPAASKVTLELEGEGFVDAWVEATFDDASAAGSVLFDMATRAGTINVPATHPGLIAVGCTINRTQWVDRDGWPHDVTHTSFDVLAPADGSCYFSSAGPTAAGVSKPDISAPGAMVAAAMSRHAVPGVGFSSVFDAPFGLCPEANECLVVDGGHALLSGSSMSSPQVAGAVALLLEKSPRLTQPEILRTLQVGARLPESPIIADYQLGPGALDVAGAMDALDLEQTSVAREPDAAASWLSLSSNYLHPGRGPLLVGTVAVRAADGSIADRFDAARLSLDVGREGRVEEPLLRVSPGLYRFAVAAEPGAGTRTLAIDVRIDGTTIGRGESRLFGRRLVPIGADRWIATGTTRVYGGCGIAARQGRSVAEPIAWLVFGSFASIAAAARGSRRRRSLAE